MNSKKNGAVLGLVLGMVSLGSALVLGQPSPVPPGSPGKGAPQQEARNRGRRGNMLMQQLNLTPEQQKKLKELREAMKAKAQPLRTQLQAGRSELQNLWKGASPDRSAILAKMAELDGLRRQMCEARVDFRLGLQAVLTPEQRAKMGEMRGKFGRGGRAGRGRRGGHHRGGGDAAQDEEI